LPSANSKAICQRPKNNLKNIKTICLKTLVFCLLCLGVVEKTPKGITQKVIFWANWNHSEREISKRNDSERLLAQTGNTQGKDSEKKDLQRKDSERKDSERL
jgi:hypothetical protein